MREIQLTTGEPVPEDDSHRAIDPKTGMQKGYVVLSPEERAKGFVKPVRRKYRHTGPPAAPANLRDLTAEEIKNHGSYGYVKFEPYEPGSHGSATGRFWTQPQLDRAGRYCGVVTMTALSLAETYARDPHFYSGTFCVGCGTHYPLLEFLWEPDGEPMEPGMQAAWAVEQAARQAQHRKDRIQVLRTAIAEQQAQLDKLLQDL